ncbi:hypothetical protein [Dehalogenimonas etheniformans]|uniref:Uncharacterized protein n=1 Tax=Dehalogenimonas etheniformans TaxID=1536648 RepID=A0A2P5P817_9CHLR|nr:hypothetical protein [Dehalogenimonas etheniformans]PPD58429.1 hypothetical protein JP09_004095 [Dehalogenimonas etheniformans]QNT75886.1 hypothetical protein HX448_03875 [Dehalogenimonas etheniformans]
MTENRTNVQTNNPPEILGAGHGKRGAPKGNLNARHHGLRSPRIIEAQRRILREETDYGRIDREILLAVFQTVMVNSTGATTRVVLRLQARLARLMRIKYGVHLDDLEALENAARRVAVDLPLTKELAAKLAAASKEPPAVLTTDDC